MPKASLLGHLRQQFAAELFATQAPSSRFEFVLVLCLTARLHSSRKLFATCGTVQRNTPLAEQTENAKPNWPARRRLQIVPIAAPPVALQRLLGCEQAGPDRVEVHIIAHCF